jgi:rfaE bifunctional protein nucleotidyltransferase chain/domain
MNCSNANKMTSSTSSKYLPLSKLVKRLPNERKTGKKIVFTNGCFDILHAGHVSYLQKAASLGDLLIIGLNSDASVKKIKGPTRPLNNEKARGLVLSALACVDYVVCFSENTPEALIQSIRPDFLVKGGDWKKMDIVGSSFVESYGGKVRSIPFVSGFSTTSLIQKIKSAT